MITTTDKHTPGPWVIDPELAHTITTPGGMTIAKAESNREEWQANAEYIVRACNSYPALLEACKAQHKAIDYLFAMLIERDKKFYPSKSGLPWDAMKTANAVITRAEGGT